MNNFYLLVLTVVTVVNAGIFFFSPSARTVRKTRRDMQRTIKNTTKIDEELFKEVTSTMAMLEEQNKHHNQQFTALTTLLAIMRNHAEELELSYEERSQLIQIGEMYSTDDSDLNKIISVYKRLHEQSITKH